MLETLTLMPAPKPYCCFPGQSSGPLPRRDQYSPAPSSPASFRSESPSRWRTDTAGSCRAPSAPSLCRGPRWSPAPARTRAPLRRVARKHRHRRVRRCTVAGFQSVLRLLARLLVLTIGNADCATVNKHLPSRKSNNASRNQVKFEDAIQSVPRYSGGPHCPISLPRQGGGWLVVTSQSVHLPPARHRLDPPVDLVRVDHRHRVEV